MTFLGIDGGGSKTSFILEDDTGREAATLETGPSNWISSNTDRARQSITSGIQALPFLPDVVCGGFAGAGRPEGQAFFRECLQSLLPKAQIFIETDAAVAYFGAIGPRPGVLLTAGTGSIALARAEDGTFHRVGGWGSIFGDEGSGFWLGRSAVSAALRAHDTGSFPDFVAAITKHLGLQTIVEAPTAWKAGTLGVTDIAGLARLLLDDSAEEPAAALIRQAALELRKLVVAAVERAGLPQDCLRSAAGSLATHPAIQEFIALPFTPAQHSPAQGAIILARDRMPLS